MGRYPKYPTSFEAEAWVTIYQTQGGKCKACKQPFDMSQLVRPGNKFAAYCNECIQDVDTGPLIIIPGTEGKTRREKEAQHKVKKAERKRLKQLKKAADIRKREERDL